jgi:hypothetical protein
MWQKRVVPGEAPVSCPAVIEARPLVRGRASISIQPTHDLLARRGPPSPVQGMRFNKLGDGGKHGHPQQLKCD